MRLDFLIPALLLALSSTPTAAAITPFQLPPAGELLYTIKAKQSGIALSGTASVKWQLTEKKYAILTETRAMLFGKILNADSVGSIDAHGLAPDSFTEKRFGKDATVTSFERSKKLLRFSTSAQTYPLNGGEQDRTSAVWQLVALARAAGAAVKPGSEWSMFVAGRRDAEPWTFKVLAAEPLHTALGEFTTLHISKAPPPDSKDQTLDIWLAPDLEWYPVRVKFSDAEGEYVDQLLESVKKF
ncbi:MULTISPECIES: DUF3108 domain-containing protein [unclassified Undibacterium]|uniref:DUF3108 domain-containing protein n=1 Tax=unclassified Undibacterium TaxID=2630295 RepID=UPI002AC9D7A4|nr:MULTISPECIES: DUF3108 domain-containing protein [unclassified Undibacterium]MEB0138986.1 DUF3108 domain-containing protein [Undibacterium sp. CCC2.1]MEB0171919.1 DUF3108 domain-containing protein [Undibacterium sp. CCC1.1]MEB0175860.1 DUF3108 domain-containing protein [Undibacterium sp. CCC3.4]MEB0215074.1 DUF3108 domain-containing protein [Undibacterium sp. 5I2]WPX45045.1 DUF3108 domain-containing protein [Undibacterium sp. CCC3.4]